MLINLKQPLIPGESFRLILFFQKPGEIVVDAHVLKQ